MVKKTHRYSVLLKINGGESSNNEYGVIMDVTENDLSGVTYGCPDKKRRNNVDDWSESRIKQRRELVDFVKRIPK